MKFSRAFTAAAMAMSCLAMASCAHFGGKDKKASDAPAAMEAAPAPKTEADYKAELLAVVDTMTKAANDATEEQRGRVIRRKPYFYREYSVYDTTGDSKVILQQKEKKSSPYIADVVLKKERFATRLHRKRAEAQGDVSFLRDTGAETLTYEWRSGQWVRTGSIFVADKSEENINGEWLPVKETVKRTVAAEEEKSEGFLKRFWYTITGR